MMDPVPVSKVERHTAVAVDALELVAHLGIGRQLSILPSSDQTLREVFHCRV